MVQEKDAWRLIEDGLTDGYMNMAVDEAIFIACGKGLAPKTIRFYGWSSPFISIGYFQKTGNLFKQERLKELSLKLVRRPTGGRAVYHEDEITYSVVSSLDSFSGEGIVASYKIISHALISGLKSLGVKAELVSKRGKQRRGNRDLASCFSSLSLCEVAVHGKKIIGSAQKRSKTGLLQQGSLPIYLNREKLAEIFKKGSDEKMTCLREVLDKEVTFDSISKRLIQSVSKGFGSCVKGRLTPFEKELAEKLRTEKYRSGKWNFQR